MNKEQIQKLRTICKNISVLYVEDDQAILVQVERMLRKIFTNVAIEKNGLLGLKNYTKNRQDIVITDISMPILDGIEMAKKIKLLNPEQSILITSAYNDAEYLIGLIEVGIEKFVTKPIDMGSFLSSISKIAIGIYREKRELLLESKLEEQQNLQIKIFNATPFPLAYFDGDVVVYANNAFESHFFTPLDLKDTQEFRLGYLFEQKKYLSLSNSTLLDEIEKSSSKIFTVMDVKKKITKKYNISIAKITNNKQRLVSFINLDEMSMEFDRLKTQIDYFPKREAFANAVMEQKNRSQYDYGLFCIGLKNIARFVNKYGGVKMHTVYKELAKNIKKEFVEAIEKQLLSIYLFETNRYILLADESIVEDVYERLNRFGAKYNFEYGSRLSFDLNIAKEQITQSRSASDVFENAEGMLYTFDD